MILYIHGFNSSPQSFKAQKTTEYIAQLAAANKDSDLEILVPKVPCYPQQAFEYIEKLYLEHQDKITGIMGSSLGGYIATYLTEKYQVKSVLINPAVRPYELLADHIGPQTNPYTNETYQLTEAHIDELKRFDTPVVKHHSCFWLLQQEGDEVLDYTQAVDKYQGCRMDVEEGGDHSFIGFERYLPEIIEFFQV